MSVAHLAFDFGAGHKGGDRIDHDHIHCAGTDEGFGDFEGLFAGIGLGNVEIIYIDAASGGVLGVESVLHIYESADAAAFLGFGDDVLAEGGLAGGLGAVDFDDSAARNASYS
jgi:hypothetical protein